MLPVAADAQESGEVLPVTHNVELHRKASASKRPMRLEGVEALELYLLEIEHNLAQLAEQVALLQATLVERRRLLCAIAASRDAHEYRGRPAH
jgi:hypothetical protein